MTKYDVFISFASKDQKVVEGICGYLERNNYRCFVSYRDISPSEVWAKALTNAIDASAMMLVVFSEYFNISEQTDREIELASENKIPILTYRIENKEFQGAKKYYLKNINWIDAFPEPEKQFGKLLETVKKLIGDRTISKPITPVVPNSTANTQETQPAKQQPAGAEIHIETDRNCRVYRFQKEIMHAEKGKDNVLYLVKGKHKLEFIADGNPTQTLSKVIEIPDNNYSDFVEISFADKPQQPAAAKQQELSVEEMYKKARELYDKGVKAFVNNNRNKEVFGWLRKAAELSIKAAEQGHADAQLIIGGCYLLGVLGPDTDKGMEWLTKAAEQGNVEAQCNLGMVYRGTDYHKAVEWLTKAAEQGDERAIDELKRLGEK